MTIKTDAVTYTEQSAKKMKLKTRGKSKTKTYTWPLVFAVLSAIGLIAALVGDGPWDQLSWLTLGIPTVTCIWIMLGAKRFGS